MATPKVEPDPSATERQLRVQRARRRKTAAFALVAACMIAAAVVACARPDGDTERPSTSDSREPPALGPFHYVDIRTGATAPMPENIDEVWSVVSPDGRMFVYGRDDSVFVANVDGSNERQVTPDGVPAGIGGWSPDGSTIVYQGGARGLRTGNVFTVDLSTGETTQLTDLEQVLVPTGITAMEPVFGPDGETASSSGPDPAAASGTSGRCR